MPGYPEIKVDRFASYDKLTTDEFPLAQTRVLTAIEDFTRKLDIPVLYPVTTNMIMQQEYRWRSGLLLAELALTNGMFFKFEWGIITEFETKQHYNVAHRGIFLKDFYGPWKLSEKQALKVARDPLVKLGYDPKDFGLNEKPKIRKPTIPNIPRFVFNWDKGTGGVALYYYATEINAATGGVEALSAFTPKIAKEYPPSNRPQRKTDKERAILQPPDSSPSVSPSRR